MKKDLKQLSKSGDKKALKLTYDIINRLANNETLEAKYRDHSLNANNYITKNERCVHILFDLLLIYKIENDTLYLMQLGTHHNLKGFKEEVNTMNKELTQEEIKAIYDKFDFREHIKENENRLGEDAEFNEIYGSRLEIKEKEVIFDNDFKFVLSYKEPKYAEETKDVIFDKDIWFEGSRIARKGDSYHQEKGELLFPAFISLTLYIDDRVDETMLGDLMITDDVTYNSDEKDFLTYILYYIETRI